MKKGEREAGWKHPRLVNLRLTYGVLNPTLAIRGVLCFLRMGLPQYLYVLHLISHCLGAGHGGMVIARILQWISEAAAGGPWSVMVPIVGGLRAFLWTPHLGS